MSPAESMLRAAHAFQRFNEAWRRAEAEERRQKELWTLRNRENWKGKR